VEDEGGAFVVFSVVIIVGPNDNIAKSVAIDIAGRIDAPAESRTALVAFCNPGWS
jgi:hypothetical protein